MAWIPGGGQTCCWDRCAPLLGERDSPEEQRRQTLFFETGGRYTAAELRTWASMLETLEAAIRLMHEDLEVLLREIVEYERSLVALDQRMTR